MKKRLFFSAFLFCFISGFCQSGTGNLYSASFGDKSDPAIVFLHGGPGYNSFTFEVAAAEKLADAGYHVIVFDQRGCGRSKDIQNANYTFEEAFKDIRRIYSKYGIKKATLLGHSWGGTLGIKFASKYPEKVENLVLMASPLSYQRTFKTIIDRCEEVYEAGNSSQLRYIKMLKKMDSTSLDYANYCFMHARNCGLYETENQTEKASRLYTKIKTKENSHLASNMTHEPVSGFYKNERYTTLDLTSAIKNLDEKVEIYGIYGEDDGLFDETHLDDLKKLIGRKNFAVVQDASHSVFIDQREKFIELMQDYLE